MDRNEWPEQRLRVRFGKLILDEDIRELCRIDSNDLDTELEEHSGVLAYLGGLEAEAEAQAERAENKRDRMFDQLYLDWRAGKDAGMKMTEALIKANIERDPGYTQLVDDCIEAKMIHRKLQRLVSAFASREKLLCARVARQGIAERDDPTVRGERISSKERTAIAAGLAKDQARRSRHGK